MKIIAQSITLALAASALLLGCGGTNPSQDTSNRIVLNVESQVSLSIGESITLSATANSAPTPISSMSWSALPNGSASLTLANSNCAQRNVNSSSSSLDPSSNWTCPLQITAPTAINSDTQFKLTVTTTDTKGNTASKDVNVTVKQSNVLPPVATISAPDVVDAGKAVNLSCSAQGGNITSTGKYTFQYVVSDNGNVPGVKLTTNASSPEIATFTAPGVTRSTNVVFSCRATDSLQKTGVATKTITINPIAAPTLIALVEDLLSYPAGSTVTLNGLQSLWYSSSVGAVSPQPPIYYWWTQTAGTPVQILNQSSAQPTVVFPSKASSDGTKRETYMFTLTVSDSPFVNGVTTGTTASTTGIYFVNYISPISITIPTVTAVKSNSLASAQVNAVGQSGQTLYYAWTQVSGPPVTLAGWNTPTVSFLAPVNPGPTTQAVVLRVAVDYVPIVIGNTTATFTDVLVPITP